MTDKSYPCSILDRILAAYWQTIHERKDTIWCVLVRNLLRKLLLSSVCLVPNLTMVGASVSLPYWRYSAPQAKSNKLSTKHWEEDFLKFKNKACRGTEFLNNFKFAFTSPLKVITLGRFSRDAACCCKICINRDQQIQEEIRMSR